MTKSKTKTLFICQSCGAKRPKWEGRCGDCGEWNTYVEELEMPTSSNRSWSIQSKGQVLSLDQTWEDLKVARHKTGIFELDRVLGGGLVPGSFILLGGDPGIGKSTLLIQAANSLAEKQNLSVLYVSAEESINQTGLRAKRLGLTCSKVKLASESQIPLLIDIVEEEKPNVLIVDSIQTFFLPEIPSAPGSVTQVRECAARLMSLAKNKSISVFVIGHVNKEGNIAGPKVLEHMVDTVLSFEGDSQNQFRLLRSLKNRFGPTHELGVFSMEGEGLKEVSNPSELFLQEKKESAVGSAIFSSLEGTRPLLCEIQALVSNTPMPMPRRTSLGIDVNRVHLISAVIGKKLPIHFYQSDIYVNVVGGLKIIEPAVDLALATALISSEKNKKISSQSCFLGEIGLTGEIRAVSQIEVRIKEGIKLGFKNFYVPLANKKHLQKSKLGEDVNLVYLSDISEIPAKVF